MLKILAVLALLAGPTFSASSAIAQPAAESPVVIQDGPTLPASSAIAQSETERPVVTQDGADIAADESIDYGWLGLAVFLSLLGIMRFAVHKRKKDTSVHFDQL